MIQKNTKWIADRYQSNDLVFFIVCAEQRLVRVQVPGSRGPSGPHLPRLSRSFLTVQGFVLEMAHSEKVWIDLRCQITGAAPPLLLWVEEGQSLACCRDALQRWFPPGWVFAPTSCHCSQQPERSAVDRKCPAHLRNGFLWAAERRPFIRSWRTWSQAGHPTSLPSRASHVESPGEHPPVQARQVPCPLLPRPGVE